LSLVAVAVETETISILVVLAVLADIGQAGIAKHPAVVLQPNHLLQLRRLLTTQ
jgi:hypothetical protein